MIFHFNKQANIQVTQLKYTFKILLKLYDFN